MKLSVDTLNTQLKAEIVRLNNKEIVDGKALQDLLV